MTGSGHLESGKRTFAEHSSVDNIVENLMPIGFCVTACALAQELD